MWKWLYHKYDGEVLYRVIPIQRVTDGAITNKADAVLVAAAPDLLHALQDLLAIVEGHTSEFTQNHYKKEIAAARTAVEKASIVETESETPAP